MPGADLDKWYVNDRWTLDIETLGFDRLAWEVARKALYCQPPFAQCVVGRWGSGKTSVMRYAMALLGGEMPVVRVESTTEHAPRELKDLGHGGTTRVDALQKEGEEKLFSASFIDGLHFVPATANEVEKGTFGVVTTLWFSPWRFQHEPNPMVPLLHQIRDHFTQWAKTQKKLERAAKLAIEAGLAQLGKLADTAAKLAWGFEMGAAGGIEAAKRAAAKLDKETYATLTDAERFNLQFEAAIRTILNAKSGAKEDARPPHRLIIFIDDLDRVEDQAVVRLLEALKLYLSTEQCVFVFGLDLTAVETAVGNYWKGRPTTLAREYLDKLFQSYVYMPSTGNYAQLVQRHLEAWELLPASEPLDETSQVIARILPPNPRKVKNFLNSLRLGAKLCIADETTPMNAQDLLHFALVHRLRTWGPSTFLLLCEDPLVWKEFGTFAQKASQGDGLDDASAPHFRAVFVNEFGHLVKGIGKDKSIELSPALEREEIRVRIDRIGAGRRFFEHWVEANLDRQAFLRWATGEVQR